MTNIKLLYYSKQNIFMQVTLIKMN